MNQITQFFFGRWESDFKKRLQQRYFPVNIVKVLRTHILKNICEWLLLYFQVRLLTYFTQSTEKQLTGIQEKRIVLKTINYSEQPLNYLSFSSQNWKLYNAQKANRKRFSIVYCKKPDQCFFPYAAFSCFLKNESLQNGSFKQVFNLVMIRKTVFFKGIFA